MSDSIIDTRCTFTVLETKDSDGWPFIQVHHPFSIISPKLVECDEGPDSDEVTYNLTPGFSFTTFSKDPRQVALDAHEMVLEYDLENTYRAGYDGLGGYFIDAADIWEDTGDSDEDHFEESRTYTFEISDRKDSSTFDVVLTKSEFEAVNRFIDMLYYTGRSVLLKKVTD